jgi:SAM-dependent methyltransferase
MADADDPYTRDLRGGFDAAAEDYERTRPVCPPQLFDDLIDVGGLRPGDRVAEIGCGTGQATVPMAERGLAVTAVDLGANLAAIARRKVAGFPRVSVVVSAFEDWQPDRAEFDAVVSVNALHWVDAPVRYARPHALLRPDGILAVAGCMWARPADADPFWTEVQADYLAAGFSGIPPPPPEQIGPLHLPPDAGDLFAEVAARLYPFQVRLSAADYVANLAGQCGTRSLGPDGAAEFLGHVRRRLAALGDPVLTATFVGFLTIGRRR